MHTYQTIIQKFRLPWQKFKIWRDLKYFSPAGGRASKNRITVMIWQEGAT
jgi:hypothetical protein